MIKMNLVSEDSSILTAPCQNFNFDAPPFDPKEFAESLYDFMKSRDGLGLSANQVGYPYRIFAIRTDDSPLIIFNPKIVDQSENIISMKEGCLSFPLLFLNVKRPDRIRIRFQHYDAKTQTSQFIGMTARIALHEYDHLGGELFTQKASAFETQRAMRKRMILKRKVNK